MMKYSLLGKSDLRISQVSLGCMSLPNDEEKAAAIIHHAVDKGINFFDTADIYQGGANEVIVGKALKPYRNNIFLASKVGNVPRKEGAGLDWNPSKAHILNSIEGSLRRLQTSYLDLYQLHGGTIQDNIDETIEAFELLKKQGKIRNYGISSIRPNVISQYVSRSSIASVMMQYSLLDRRPEEECLSLLEENKIGVLARGSLAQGLLINKPAKAYLDHTPQIVEKAAASIRSATSEGRTATQTAIKYVLSHHAVTSAVVGASSTFQLTEAAAAADAPDLTAVEIKELQQSVPALKYREHRNA